MLVKIKFNIPVSIPTVDGRKENLSPGVYERDEKIINHWFVQGLIAGGGAVIVKENVPKAPKKSIAPAAIPSNLVTEVLKATKPVLKKDIVVEEIKPVKEDEKVVETIIEQNKKQLVEEEKPKVAPLKRKRRKQVQK